MFNTLERQLTVEINKIFRSKEFNSAYCSKFKFAPNGMTLDISKSYSNDEKFNVILLVKHYGYESSSTGLSIYDDLSDYDVGKEEFSEEQFNFVLNYFKINHPDIYKYFNI